MGLNILNVQHFGKKGDLTSNILVVMSFRRFKYFVTRFHFFQRGSVCWICTTPGWDKKCMPNFRNEVTSKFMGLNERIMSIGIWMNYSLITWAEILWLRIGPVAGYCENCDGFSISKKVGDYIHHLSRRQLLKEDSSPWLYFHFILLYWMSLAK